MILHVLISITLLLSEKMEHPGKQEMESINQTTQALFEAISFPTGSQPNIAKIKDLFIEDGLMINSNGEEPEVFRVDQFVDHFHGLFEQEVITSLHEAEVHHKTKVYDRVAHRFSFYKASVSPEAEPFAVGVNTIQFVRIGGKWKISSMAWNDDNRGDGFFERTMKCVQK